MALIIKGDMPDCCGYACDLWSEGICVPLQKAVDLHTRTHDCPIIGEIPDKHGRLIDADVFWKRLQKQTMFLWTEKSKEYQYFLDVMDMVKSAPTIVEASNGTDN